ncbi:hypothetical protein GXB85_09255 [Cellulomonas sp. APG4]|uniref:hypothetical protein n=1 Tax=Cellulomonas sp. APG4 TaxID=1538656 RepID=UPI00137A7901|nr:hypothetical protein [Cellulomonas sp. APG4]NCT91135.1 hypothetical protein [Cellulomonas sp. APG4]
MQPIRPRDVARHLGLLALGVLVSLVGTGVHRASPPWGLVLALLVVVAAGVLARAWVGWTGLLTVGLAVVTTVAVLASRGPGGDVLVALDALGVVWYCGGAAVGVAAVLPRRWFLDTAVGATGPGAAAP